MKQEIRLPKGYELKELEKGVYEIVKSEFKLEVGKDYIHVAVGSLIINRSGDINNLGFIKNRYSFRRSMLCDNPKVWRKATKEEVVSFFEKHLIERYGEDWKNVKVKNCMYWKENEGMNTGIFTIEIRKDQNTWRVWNKNGCLFYKGKWAEVLEEIPTIELRGLDRKWKWCAMDDSREVYIYESKPNKHNAFDWWYDENDNMLKCKLLDQSQFTELKKLNWKDSLHKIKHV